MHALNATHAVHIDRLTKQYGSGAPTLEDISISIAPGEFVSIIGPSGCGKSTLLKVIAGLSPITSGSLAIHGQPNVDARRSISFIFQDSTLLPWRTVRDNIALGLELAHTSRELRTASTNALLSLVGLAHVADSYPRQLSGGMKMRVSIARALVCKPRVLLLDEPFAALDEITRDKINEELLRLKQEQGWTVVFVTHSVSEAVFLSTRILILAPSPGRLAHELHIDLPHPRLAAVRATESFEQLVATVSRTLRETLPL